MQEEDDKKVVHYIQKIKFFNLKKKGGGLVLYPYVVVR
jgi:hypothetical protein